MTIAASALRGMCWKTGVRKASTSPTAAALTMPCAPVLAPAELATAERAKEPVEGYAPNAAPARLHTPRAADCAREGFRRLQPCQAGLRAAHGTGMLREILRG